MDQRTETLDLEMSCMHAAYVHLLPTTNLDIHVGIKAGIDLCKHAFRRAAPRSVRAIFSCYTLWVLCSLAASYVKSDCILM